MLKLLAVAAAIIAQINGVTAVPMSNEGCSSDQILLGQCPPAVEIANPGDRIDLAASLSVEGKGNGTWRPKDRATGSPHYSGPPAYVAPPDETDGRNVCLNDQLEVIGTACAEAVEEPAPEEPEERAGPPAVVTLADIASFFPTPPSVATEPDGIGAKNMPLNSVATSSTQTLAGELFGFPVSVTFTPAGFRQDWGDGTVTDSRHGGASWAALGQAEFSPTATSHAYTAKGTYDLTVTALYTAVVDFGEWGTRAVDGLISVPGAARALRIVEVHTALVAHDCVADPAGAGCPGS
ncbi:hypothetical protein ACOKGD_02840 [Microbacterium phosphatis]|uniref:hypothetical protein n=1 Tax=Microbacterium phosphatis TaxID=3140248 RepID=UPI0031407C01